MEGLGQKAGLLSLDPDVHYSTRELRQDEGWKFDFDGVDDGSAAATEAQKNQALGQIVKEGESIMFLLAPNRNTYLRTKLKHITWCPQQSLRICRKHSIGRSGLFPRLLI